MNPKVSIVIPAYNATKHLGETVDSVISQAMTDWELIIVDDGSTDDTAKLCQSYCDRDQRITLIQKENGGQASARNLGIKSAKGEWIALLDADDLWSENKLELQIKIAIDYPDVEVIYTGGKEFTDDISKAWSRPKWWSGYQKDAEWFKELYTRSGIINSSVLIKKSCAEANGLFDEAEELRGTEDWDMWLRIAAQEVPFYGLEEELVFYRLHEGGIHFQNVRMFKGKLKVMSKHDTDKRLSKLWKKRAYRYVYRELMTHLFKEGKKDEIKGVLKDFAKIDPIGWGTLNQRIHYFIFPVSVFDWISRNIIYRVAYRIEKLRYILSGI